MINCLHTRLLSDKRRTHLSARTQATAAKLPHPTPAEAVYKLGCVSIYWINSNLSHNWLFSPKALWVQRETVV